MSRKGAVQVVVFIIVGYALIYLLLESIGSGRPAPLAIIYGTVFAAIFFELFGRGRR